MWAHKDNDVFSMNDTITATGGTLELDGKVIGSVRKAMCELGTVREPVFGSSTNRLRDILDSHSPVVGIRCGWLALINFRRIAAQEMRQAADVDLAAPISAPDQFFGVPVIEDDQLMPSIMVLNRANGSKDTFMWDNGNLYRIKVQL